MMTLGYAAPNPNDFNEPQPSFYLWMSSA
jgi:hypothetical protein